MRLIDADALKADIKVKRSEHNRLQRKTGSYATVCRNRMRDRIYTGH